MEAFLLFLKGIQGLQLGQQCHVDAPRVTHGLQQCSRNVTPGSRACPGHRGHSVPAPASLAWEHCTGQHSLADEAPLMDNPLGFTVLTVLCGYSCQYICFLRQITNANMPCHQCVEVTSAKQAGHWAAETSLRSLDAWGKRWEAHAQIIQLGIHTNISGHLQFTSVKFREGRGNKEEEKKKHHHHYKSI